MFQLFVRLGRLSYFPWEAVVPIALLFFTLYYSPYLRQFEIDTDEGINLAKASLVNHGYALYTSIWSDQPPVYTYLLSYAFRIFDTSVTVARMVTLFLSCVLLWAAALCVRLAFGRTHAVVAGILIVSLPLYLRLSNAIMIGLPAIAFAMSSLAAITLWHLRRRPIWLVLSGSTLAISVFTKGFTGILVPIFCVGIIIDGYAPRGATDSPRARWRAAWRGVALWLGAFLVVAGSLFILLVGPIGAAQLVRPHLLAMGISYQQAPDLRLPRYFGMHHWLLVLALVGTILALLKKQWLCMYMAGWAFSAFILLFWHRPVWSHHQLLVTVPAAPLAAIVIAELMLCIPRALRSKQMAFAGKLALAGAAGGIALWCITLTALPATAKTLRGWILAKSTPVDAANDKLLAYLRQNARGSDWLVTDRPMYAFRAGLMIPPYLAVFSAKRLATGALTERAIISTIREVQPTQVLLGRFQLPPLRAYLEQHYHLIYSQQGMELYVKNCKSSACLEIPDDWRSDEAIRIGDNLLLFQRDTGGWPKDIDMAVEPAPASKMKIARAKARRDDSTIDNGATTTQMRYLASLYNATKTERFKGGFLKGLDYLLNAQYENGGWPQVYPINPSKYSAHITFNDDAMTNVLMRLHDIISRNQDFAFVDKARLDRAPVALQKGIEIVLKTQIVVNGKRTAWAQQYDEKTLVPRPGRAYELESISARESVTIVRFLMSLEKPSPEIIEAVQSAIAWLEKVKLVGIRVVEKQDPALPRGFDRIVIKDPNAPPIWARFYEIGTNQPFFVGRDGVKKHSLAEIEAERRSGYDYYVDAPASLLAKDYPAWRKKWAR